MVCVLRAQASMDEVTQQCQLRHRVTLAMMMNSWRSFRRAPSKGTDVIAPLVHGKWHQPLSTTLKYFITSSSPHHYFIVGTGDIRCIIFCVQRYIAQWTTRERTGGKPWHGARTTSGLAGTLNAQQPLPAVEEQPMTGVLSGTMPSPLLFGATLQHHQRGTEGDWAMAESAKHKKGIAQEMLEEAWIRLVTWHSNSGERWQYPRQTSLEAMGPMDGAFSLSFMWVVISIPSPVLITARICWVAMGDHINQRQRSSAHLGHRTPIPVKKFTVPTWAATHHF